MEPIAVTSKTELFNGDVLVTKTKGHTVVVVSGNPRRGNAYYPKYEGASGSIITALAAVGEKDTSKAHRAKIAAANGITNYAYTAAQNTKMVNLLKKGSIDEMNLESEQLDQIYDSLETLGIDIGTAEAIDSSIDDVSRRWRRSPSVSSES